MAEIPREVLQKQGSTSGKKQLAEKGKEYFIELGKKSAAKRKSDKRFNRAYYQNLARRGQEAKKAKKEGRELPPMQPQQSPLKKLTNFLKSGQV